MALLSRNSSPGPATETFFWNLEQGEIDSEALNSCDFIIHLAGTNIGGKRWTRTRKEEIVNSRIKSAELIFNKLDKKNMKLKAFISASAIGYYGAVSTDRVFDESATAADDFLGKTCRDWEEAADRFHAIGIRTVKIRTGIVLSEKGGALPRIHMPVKLGLGAPIGQGKQYMPWIHINDLCAIYIHALEQENMQGAYNAVAPEHITNNAFTRTIAQILQKPYWFPNIPAAAMNILFGKMAVMLLEGSRVSSDKIRNTGFNYLFPDLESALKNLYSK